MKNIKSITALILTALIAFQVTGMTYVSAESYIDSNEESSQEEIVYYSNTDPILKEVEEPENPDLYALAKKYGYDSDTFKFTNFRPDDEGRIPEDIYDEEFNKVNDEKFSSEEDAHSTMDLALSTAGGCCYGMSAIPVLIHNGIITPSDLHEGAKTLNEIDFDAETIGRYILQYSFSQVYHAVQFAHFGDYCIKTDEELVAELLEMAVNCTQNEKYFQIAYGIQTDERSFNHAVVGIGTATGKWTVNDVVYDTCILTYDSNRANKEDNSVAGGFSENLCIYINSETNQFCIPGYEISSENGGFIFFSTDSSEVLSYRADINGTNTVGKDISGLVQMNQYYGTGNGISVSALNGKEGTDITDLLKSQFATLYGGSFFIYPATEYRIEQRNSADYNNDDTAINGSIWGVDYCIRYGADDYFDYAIDVSPNDVSVTNLGKTGEIIHSTGFRVIDEMELTCSISYDDEYYYTFAGTAAENETVTMKKVNEDVIITSDDGTLKGTLLIRSNNDSIELETGTDKSYIEYTVNAKNGIYCDMEDGKLTVYVDKDGDGTYETPIEKGDANGDGEINPADATEVLKGYAERAAGLYLVGYKIALNANYPLSPNTSDMDGDGKITISDATEILSKYARRAAGLE